MGDQHSDNGTVLGNNNSPRNPLQALKQEKHRRRKLSRLYTEQATLNEHLKEENESLQSQQRALVRLLQEKDKMIETRGVGRSSAARQGSVERFVKRFNRDIEEPD